jgi:hypothetical protein
VKGAGPTPQRAPKRNYLVELAKTPEGRAQLAEWSRRPRRNAGRPAGVPDGFTKETIEPVREQARERAEEIVKEMAEQHEELKDDELAQKALKTAVEIMETPGAAATRLAASRTVLEWTKKKPATDANVNLKAEDFLEALAHKDSDETGAA